jgi:GntR family transcriptional regulator/MocR family aminotransferase
MADGPPRFAIFSDAVRHVKDQSKGPVATRRPDLFLPPIVLDRASGTPLHLQVSAQLAAAVNRGVHHGARLPSTRLLARMLGVSRNTIVTAYDDLVASGVIEGRPGSSMVIATSRPGGTASSRSGRPGGTASSRSGRPGGTASSRSGRPEVAGAFDPQRVLRDAQYPARRLEFGDPDGSALYLI